MNTLSSLLGAISLIGFLGFIAGVGLVVVSASQGRSVRGGVMLAIFGVLVGMLFSVASSGIIIVQPQETAVVFNVLSGELGEPRGRGTHIIIPIVQEATLYPIAQQQYTMSGIPNEGAVVGNDAVRARTVDGQEIFMDITVIYSVDPVNVNTVHTNWQRRYQDDFLRPTVRGVVREEVTNFRAEEIYGERRSELENSIQSEMETRMEVQGLKLTDILIRDVTFSEEFTKSVEDKLIADQQAQQAAFRVQQEQQEAERVRVTAQGRRDAAISEAEGEAQAIVLKAQAEAEALRLVSEQIAANPSLIQYQYIMNLSDNVSMALIPTNSPFLFDFASLAEPDASFAPPEIPDVTLPEASDLEGTGD
jgi:regulator of protease activity HflC (stomatin/prohibitin superfamily)